jgi:mannitol-specific phosphotransferase system IIBC component
VGGEDLLWAVIVGQGNGSRLNAVVDTSAAIFDIANLGASNGRGVSTSRCGVIGTTWTIGVIAAGRVAVIIIVATVYASLVLNTGTGGEDIQPA